MVARYWVGGTGTWDASSTTHWSASSGGAAGASAPTSSDNVIVDSASGNGTITVASGAACNNCTVNWTSSKTNILSLSANWTVTGTLTIAPPSAVYPIWIKSSVEGTARTLSAAAVSLANVDFMDITGTGTATWTGTSLGDCGGNSGISFTSAVPQYWYTATTGTKTWSTAGNWYLGSGGTGGAGRIPLPQDPVIFDSASIGATGTTVQLDMYRAGKTFTATGVSNSPTFTTPSFAPCWFGSITADAGMATGDMFGRYGVNAYTYTASSITFTGKRIAQDLSTYLYALGGGSWSFNDDARFGGDTTGSGFSLRTGTLNTNSHSVTCDGNCIFQPGTTINAGTSTFTVSYQFNGLSSGFNGASATVVLPLSGNVNNPFLGGGSTFGTVRWTGTSTYPQAIASAYNNTIGTLEYSNTLAPLVINAGTTQTVTNLLLSGGSAAGTKFARFNGNASEKISTPSAAANQVTGDIEFIAYVSSIKYSQADQTITGKDSASGVTAAYSLLISRTGATSKTVSLVIAGVATVDSTAALTTADGSGVWIKVNRASATGAVNFYTSTDPATTAPLSVSWSALGTTVTGASGAITAGTSPLAIGANAANSKYFWGKIYRATIANSIGGAAVVDFNPTSWSSGTSWTSATGEVWTFSGAAHVSAENLIDICSTTGTQANITPAGSGNWYYDYLSLSNIKSTVANRFYAGATSLDGSGNTNVYFWAAGRIAATDAGDSDAVTGAIWTTAQIASTDAGDVEAVTGAIWTTAQITSTDAGDVAAAIAEIWTTAQISATDAGDAAVLSGIAYLKSNPKYLLTHTARNFRLTHVKRDFVLTHLR